MSLAEAFAPLACLAGILLLTNAALPMARTWARALVVGVVWLMIARYLVWRATSTLYAPDLSSGELAWIWTCFAIELLALADASLLYLAFVKTSDRSAEADRHEAVMRVTPAVDQPSVDVFITTYNEPFEVVEKTIIGALALDYANLQVWVLDDGRRVWLRDYCERKGVGYINRPDNKGAKAGNINHALQVTDGDYVMVLDADFVPQRNLLMRAMGFFEDPTVGIVQIPHAFYNNDPMQTNLSLRKAMPDDQRFFFETIMPSRDGWDAAFCCGSNSITRREAIEEAGGGLPHGSITEDMLLSLVLLRHGYVTRYLSERLAFGLAPESITAFFVQRQRWARGAIQMLFLSTGPLGRGLGLVHRLLFMPTHWLTMSLMTLISLVSPPIFLLFQLAPITNVTLELAIYYVMPMVVATVGGLVAFAPGAYFPLAAWTLGAFQSFKLLPTVISTFIKPHGHVFKVTPKGKDSEGSSFEWGIFLAVSIILAVTVVGLALNTIPELRLVEESALIPLVSFWACLNCVILFLVMMMCLQLPVRRAEERFALAEPLSVRTSGGVVAQGEIVDMSLSGVAAAGLPNGLAVGDKVAVRLADVGRVEGEVVRSNEAAVGIEFDLPESIERDLLIRKLFTSGYDPAGVTASVWSVTAGMLQRVFTLDASIKDAPEAFEAAPDVDEAKLPAMTYVMPPASDGPSLDEIIDALDDVLAELGRRDAV